MVWLQHVVPQKTLSRIVRAATRVTWTPWKNLLIRHIVRSYGVNMDEALEPNPTAHPHFNAFFTRALKSDARPLPDDTNTLVMPADGKISQMGRIDGDQIVQAKGHDYTTAELLGDASLAEAFHDGWFANVYLSPRDYHRVHMPWTGKLLRTIHVPGKLFSVAPKPVANIPRLFARNERLVCVFEGEFGGETLPFVVVMVGAVLVSGIETVWSGEVVPPYATAISKQDWQKHAHTIARGDEMARFNMGSTAIVLLPKHGVTLREDLDEQAPVQMGQALGSVGI